MEPVRSLQASERKHTSDKMVKNKNNTRGHPSCSSTCKKKKAGCQIASSEDKAPLGDPADSPPRSPEYHITVHNSTVHLGFLDRVYLLASVIFQNSHLEKPASQQVVNYGKKRGLPLPQVRNVAMQREAYELAFSTLQYQEVLEYVMVNSCFYLSRPVPCDQMSLVAVMLCDLVKRRFSRRKVRSEEEIQEVRDVERCISSYTTKMAASLARYRVDNRLRSVAYVLPESVRRKQERAGGLPLYAWVNTLKSSVDEVQRVLKGAGFSQVKSIGLLEGQTFCRDPHCEDVLVLPAQLKAQLCSTKLLSDHRLIIQDKSCCLGPNAVCSLLPEEGDVLMAGFFSGLTVSHTAALVAEKHRTSGSSQPTVYVCTGGRTSSQATELEQAIAAVGCKNVKLMPEDLQSLDKHGDKRLQRVSVILLTPKCSMSAVNNLVEFMLQENADTDLLQDLSRGCIAQSKLDALVARQRRDIDQALKLPKVLSVVYSTCSSHAAENEEVVKAALERAEACSGQEGEPKQAVFRLSPSPFRKPEQAESPEKTDPFFVLEPSEESNGCFLAVLDREPEPVVKESPQEVILRANAKGILDKIGTRREQRGQANRPKKTSQSRAAKAHVSVSSQSKNREIKSSNKSTRQELPGSELQSRGKPKALRPLASKNTTSSCSSSSSSSSYSFSLSKQESTSTPRAGSSVIKTSTSAVLDASSSPSGQQQPLVLEARSRRAHQEVLRPVVLTLPSIHFPDFFPLDHGRPGFSPGHRRNKGRGAAHACRTLSNPSL